MASCRKIQMTMLIIKQKLICICSTLASTLWKIFIITYYKRRKYLKCPPPNKHANKPYCWLSNYMFSTLESRVFIFTSANKNYCYKSIHRMINQFLRQRNLSSKLFFCLTPNGTMKITTNPTILKWNWTSQRLYVIPEVENEV